MRLRTSLLLLLGAHLVVASHAAAADELPVSCDVPGIFDAGARWTQLSGGHAGCEGPQWVGHGDEVTLYYAAHHDHLAYRWTPRGGLEVWRSDSPEATAFRPDGQGGFYVVEQTTRRLVRWDAEGKLAEVLADRFDGKRLNRPNDVIVRSDGTLWFTDPDFLFKVRTEEVKEQRGQYVYRFDPKTEELAAVVRELILPNGIAFSRDEKWLYVTDSATENVYRWPVGDDDKLGTRATFATFAEKGLDGVVCDAHDRVWVATMKGVRITSAEGKPLGLLKTPGKPTAIAFGPDGWLCVTTRDACYITHLATGH